MKVIGVILAMLLSAVGTDVITVGMLNAAPASWDVLGAVYPGIVFVAQLAVVCLVCLIFWRVFRASRRYRLAYLVGFPLVYAGQLIMTFNPPMFVAASVLGAFIAAAIGLWLFTRAAWSNTTHD